MTIPSAAQQACPARQVCGLTRDCFVQFVRRLATKELVFLRFVAPRNAGVNGKKRNVEIGRGPAVRRVLLMAVTEVLRGTADRTASGARETLLLPQEAPRR